MTIWREDRFCDVLEATELDSLLIEVDEPDRDHPKFDAEAEE